MQTLPGAVDDGTFHGKRGALNFDDEGIIAVKRPIFDKGILKTYYIDNYYGRKLGMKPTSGSSSNVVFSKGTRSLDEMIRSMNKGVEC